MPEVPSWASARDYLDTDLGPLTTGKEADVFFVERSWATGTVLLAHKRYRPRRVTHKGELKGLGFQRASTFANDAAYRDGRVLQNSRDRRAVARKSKRGREVLRHDWSAQEFRFLERAWSAGVRVPFPVEERADGFLMQFVGGDDGVAAPRVAEARLSSVQLGVAWRQVVENLRTLVGVGLVHADLSTYNLLWWRDEVFVIDLPQTVDVTGNPRALEFLHRDVLNVATFFARKGVACDGEAVFAELVAIAAAGS